MKTTFKDALDYALQVTGRSLRSVATSSGVSYDQLKNLKQGKAQSTNVDDARAVAEMGFQVTLDDFFQGRLVPDSQVSPVVGRIGAGAHVNLEDPFPKGDGHYRILCPPQISPRGIVAVEVVGDSMAPMYQPGDVLFYSRATYDGVPDEDIGRACVVEDETGRAWVKQVRRGDEPGLFHLISLNPASETRHNQRIKWASRVKLALPAEFVVKVE